MWTGTCFIRLGVGLAHRLAGWLTGWLADKRRHLSRHKANHQHLDDDSVSQESVKYFDDESPPSEIIRFTPRLSRSNPGDTHCLH